MKKQSQQGFTLIEILVVIGLIAVLAAIVIIAINPARQFAQGRDAQRNNDLNAILNAIGQKIADGKGNFGCNGLPSATTTIVSSGGGAGDLATSCLVPTYISALPVDPSGPVSPNTGYAFFQDTNGRIHVLATTTEPNIPRTVPVELVR